MTGTEALYADMSHFSAAAIRVSRCILLAFLGLAAEGLCRDMVMLVPREHTLIPAERQPGDSPLELGPVLTMPAPSLQLSFLSLVYPSLILTYLGQTAMILEK